MTDTRNPLTPPFAFGYGVRDQTEHVDAIATLLLRRFLFGLRRGEAQLEDVLDVQVVHLPDCGADDPLNGACNCARALVLIKEQSNG